MINFIVSDYNMSYVNYDWIKIFTFICQLITAFTAIILPLYVLKKTIDANKANIYLTNKIERYSQINGLLTLWYIELLKIHGTPNPKTKIINNIDNIFVEISKYRIYFDEISDEKFYELMDLTNNLLTDKNQNIDSDFKKAMNIINFLRKKFTIKEDI